MSEETRGYQPSEEELDKAEDMAESVDVDKNWAKTKEFDRAREYKELGDQPSEYAEYWKTKADAENDTTDHL